MTTKHTYNILKVIQLIVVCLCFGDILLAQTLINFSAPGTGTWTCPYGVTNVTVECFGGGGGGGGDNNVNPNSAGGGGGGGCSRQVLTVTSGTAYSYTVGVGGAGGSSTGTNGAAGTASKFFTVTANPGSGGLGVPSTSTINGTGGAGGTGNLANGTSGSTGTAGVSGIGGNSGIGSTSGFGGSSVSSNSNGMNGSAPGGGGSGANHTGGTGKLGGSGGNGLIKLSYIVPQFVTRWDLSIPGSGPGQLSFGVATTGTVSYSWQELSPGSASGTGTFSGSTFSVTGFPIGSVISLSIIPTDFKKIIINNGLDKSRLINIERWGGVNWTAMDFAFAGCNNLNISATDVPDLSSVTNMEFMFQGCSSLTGPSNINSWNTISVTNMTGLFDGASLFNQNLSNWKIVSVTSMDFMFNGANSFNQNLGSWKFNNSVSLANMLNNTALNCDNYSATLIGWDANNPALVSRNVGANGLQYGTSAISARNNLTTAKSWTITGDVANASNCSANLPVINVSYSLSPFSQVIGAASPSQTFVVSGTNLTSSISINAPINYQVSLNGSVFSNSVVLFQNAGVINNTNVFIRLNASVAGVHNGTVTISSLTAQTQTFVVNGQAYNGSLNTCSTAYELCFGTNTVVSYPAATSGAAQTGPAYDCLGSQPNPTWLYFKTNSVITNSNTSLVFTSSNNSDIDFILWGPISSYSNLCSAISNSATVKGCSFSTAATESITITNTQPNAYYVLLITNYSSVAQFINVSCTQGKNNICPEITADFAQIGSVCIGNPFSLTDLSTSNNGIDSWTYNCSAATPSVSNIQNPSFVINTSGTFPISLTVTSGTLSSTITKTITVNPNPIIQSVVSNTNTCLMSPITFSNSGASTYTLFPDNISGANISYTTTVEGINTYTIQGTDINGCIGNKIISVLTNSTPIISSVLSDNSICFGESLTFTNSGANTYTILPSNNTGSVVIETPNLTGSNTYTVIGKDNIGCVGEITKSFEVFDLPNVVITPSIASVCQGQGLQFTINGAVSYTDAIGATTQTLFTMYFGGSETYTISGEDANGCINTASASITVLSTPTVSIISPTTNICYAYTQTITANGADTYVWFNGVNTNTTVIQPFANTTYSVIGTIGGICKDTAYLSVNVLPLPNVFASASNTSVCAGQNVTLTASGNALNYLWTPGNLFGPVQTFTLNSTTTYSLFGQGANGCGNFDIITISVNNASLVTTLINPPLICIGDSATLSLIGGSVPSWSSNINPDKEIVFPTTNTTYTYNAIDVNGCITPIEFNVAINADCDIQVYNGFTPNGDGVNDYWVIDNINKLPDNKVTVFNRWGKKVFETLNYNNKDNYWNGLLDGVKVPSGTYFFIISDLNGKVYSKSWLEITY